MIGRQADRALRAGVHRHELGTAVGLGARGFSLLRLRRAAGIFDELDIAIAADLEDDIAAVGHQTHVAVTAGLGGRTLGAGPLRVTLPAALGSWMRTAAGGVLS